MAVIRRYQPGLTPPPDFGLGLAIAGVLAGALLLFILAGSSLPTHGPRGGTQPPQGEIYRDIGAPNAQPSAILPAR